MAKRSLLDDVIDFTFSSGARSYSKRTNAESAMNHARLTGDTKSFMSNRGRVGGC